MIKLSDMEDTWTLILIYDFTSNNSEDWSVN